MGFSLEPTNPPPPGDPSRQAIYMPDEDTTIRFVGYEVRSVRKWMWRVGCVLTLGVLGLLGHWFPKLWLRWVAREKAFKNSKDGFVAVEVSVFFYYLFYLVLCGLSSSPARIFSPADHASHSPSQRRLALDGNQLGVQLHCRRNDALSARTHRVATVPHARVFLRLQYRPRCVSRNV